MRDQRLSAATRIPRNVDLLSLQVWDLWEALNT
jgi:hypothetical protein